MATKFCKDCKWAQDNSFWLDCCHPINSKIVPQCLVTGRKEYVELRPEPAEEARYAGKCGKEGKLFEPKPPTIFQRFCIWAGLPKQ